MSQVVRAGDTLYGSALGTADAAPYVSSTNKRQAGLEVLCQQIEAGHLTPIVGKTFSLADVPEAIRHLEGGRAQGKIAITI